MNDDQQTIAQNAAPDAAPDAAIEARGLLKIYGDDGSGEAVGEGGVPGTRALNAIDLTVPRGSFFGLLGPNGAGKSTFINILAGLVNKTSGSASVWGFDLETQTRAAQSAIGVVPQELFIDPFFTPREALEVQAGMYAVPRPERRSMELLGALGLTDKADAYARTLSGGMKRRLLVAKAMVHTPPVLVLDEPTAGVDVELRQRLWAYLRELNRAGTTIVLTTHYLEEAEALCDTIAIINKGDVVTCAPTDELIDQLDQKTLVITVAEELAELPAGLAAHGMELRAGNRLAVDYRPSETQAGTLIDAVKVAGFTIRDLATIEGDLEDIFLQLTREGEGD